ncbi:hypothetical protein CDAR_168471 [Caerostris darwini]|uniref:Uncharacterized protein n=1 Tax=Caerostris darwini TaxID=1538125 RepID=A0AAV4T7T6_9ARAC|nr:hypothetical protein CDAR_168471 [Caerostris darwini]
MRRVRDLLQRSDDSLIRGPAEMILRASPFFFSTKKASPVTLSICQGEDALMANFRINQSLCSANTMMFHGQQLPFNVPQRQASILFGNSWTIWCWGKTRCWS